MNDSEPADQGVSPAVIEKLVAHHREFFLFLGRQVGNRAEAEDILQEAFVKGVERADSVRDGESAVAWFYRLLRNAVIDHHRRRGSAGRAMEAFARELEGANEPSGEVVETVCIEPNNAAVRVHRAREALRKRVRVSCGTCADHGCLDCTCEKAPAPGHP